MPESNDTSPPDLPPEIPSELLLRGEAGKQPTLENFPGLSPTAREEAAEILAGSRNLEALLAAAGGTGAATDGSTGLQQAVLALPEQAQRLIRERHRHQRSWLEIAQILGEPVETLRRAHAEAIVTLLEHVPRPGHHGAGG